MRTRPSPLFGIIAYLVYVGIIIALNFAIGPDFDEIAASTENLINGVIIPVGAGALGMIVLATVYGWWGPILRDRARSRHVWIAILPIATIAFAAYIASTADYSSVATDYLLVLAAGVLLVGFAEELTTRGLLLVGARGGMGEVGVFFLTTGLFALMHGVNFLFGQDITPTLQQVAFTFVYGAGYYVMRRVTGSLIPGMLMHALWDFSVFIQSEHPGGDERIGQLANVVVFILTIPCVIWAIRGATERLDLPVEPPPDRT